VFVTDYFYRAFHPRSSWNKRSRYVVPLSRIVMIASRSVRRAKPWNFNPGFQRVARSDYPVIVPVFLLIRYRFSDEHRNPYAKIDFIHVSRFAGTTVPSAKSRSIRATIHLEYIIHAVHLLFDAARIRIPTSTADRFVNCSWCNYDVPCDINDRTRRDSIVGMRIRI